LALVVVTSLQTALLAFPTFTLWWKCGTHTVYIIFGSGVVSATHRLLHSGWLGLQKKMTTYWTLHTW